MKNGEEQKAINTLMITFSPFIISNDSNFDD